MHQRRVTVSAVVPRLIVELLTADRETQEAIYQEANLDFTLIDNIDSRITHEEFQRFTIIAAERSHDPHVGLNAITSFFPSILNIVSFTMMASSTLLKALETLVKYYPIIDERIEITLQRNASVVTLAAKGYLGKPQTIVVDAGVATILRILRVLGGSRRINVHSARFSYPPPLEIERHSSILGCDDIIFDSIYNSISFRLIDLEQSIPRPSNILSVLLNELASNQLEFLNSASLVSIKVREVIARSAGGSLPTLSLVAAALHMSPRTLQRALEREGVSFRKLVDDIQRQRAHLGLRYSSRSIKEIAFELGFREQRSFHRACTRWFGMPPATYRHRDRKRTTSGSDLMADTLRR